MTPAEFIVFAGKLAAMGSGGEAAIRTIIGRAYYGTFHLTLEYLADLGFAIPANAAAHGLVQRYLTGSQQSEAVRVVGLLSNLHSLRRADYRLDDARFQSFAAARVYVETAEELRLLLENLKPDPVRRDMRQRIDAYLARLN